MQGNNLMPFMPHKSDRPTIEAGDKHILQMVMQPDDIIVGLPKKAHQGRSEQVHRLGRSSVDTKQVPA